MSSSAELTTWRRLQFRLRHLFSLPVVEISVALFVLISVVLTLTELALWDASGEQAALRARLGLINDLMTYGMVGELLLRFVAAGNKGRYLREYWLDIVSVLPLFRVFPRDASPPITATVATLRCRHSACLALSGHRPAWCA